MPRRTTSFSALRIHFVRRCSALHSPEHVNVACSWVCLWDLSLLWMCKAQLALFVIQQGTPATRVYFQQFLSGPRCFML